MNVPGFDSTVIASLCEALQEHKGISPYARVEVMSDLSVELGNGYLMVIERKGASVEHRTSVSWSDLPRFQQQALQAAVGLWATGADNISPCRLPGGRYGIGEA